MTSADATTPLHGLLVADFSRVLAGPLATMMLADLGATVIKVERPGVGDETRAWGPPYSEHGSTYFESVNRSKQSVTLDLTDAGDRALAVELALRADVVVTNFKPGTMERLGLGHDDLKDRNPGLIYCVVNGFGEAGGRDLLGYDFVVQAVGGLMSITGPADQPTKVGVAVVDVLTGKDAVIGILAAVAARARTGRGDRIEVSLLTSALGALVNQGQAALETGRAPQAMGNRHPRIAPYETLQCRDTLIAVACGNDGQFARLATVLGAPELSSRPEFATNAARVGHREQLVEQLEKQLADDDAGSWVARLTAADVPAGRVGTILEGLQLADDLGLEPTVSVGDGHRPQVRHPVRWSGYRTAPATPPPTLGEHDAAVRAWLTTADPHPHDRQLRGVSPRNLVEKPANPPIMGSGDPTEPRSDLQPSTTEVTS
jgi:crotonobetainyl-CoA:carnitine CoA-transferase CaiB-like acyl-CoA transferase